MCEEYEYQCENCSDIICCSKRIDCYEEYECKCEHYECYESSHFCCKCKGCCVSCLLCWKYFVFISIIGLQSGIIVLLFGIENDSEFNKINSFILIPIFSVFYLFFLLQMIFWNRDILLFTISFIIFLSFLIVYAVYEPSVGIGIIIFFYFFFFMLVFSFGCPKNRPKDDIKKKYLRWYTICYYIFCICSNIIYINAPKLYPKSYSKNNQNTIDSNKYYWSFLIISLIINIIVYILIILKKKENFGLLLLY